MAPRQAKQLSFFDKPPRVRDYKREYERRQAKARGESFQSYYAKRKLKETRASVFKDLFDAEQGGEVGKLWKLWRVANGYAKATDQA